MQTTLIIIAIIMILIGIAVFSQKRIGELRARLAQEAVDREKMEKGEEVLNKPLDSDDDLRAKLERLRKRKQNRTA